MNEDCLKLTAYLGERDRANGGYLADAFTGIYARHELQASLLLRATAGFGAKHQLRTDRLLTLSEDLPLVSVAVDTRARIEAVVEEIGALRFSGLVTLERARMLTGPVERVELPPELDEAAKLTVYVGRQERTAHGLAHRAVVDLLHARGIAGATVLLGIDGTAHGARERAAFFSRNADVPLMIIAIGEGRRIADVLSRSRSAAAAAADDARAGAPVQARRRAAGRRHTRSPQPTRRGSASGRSSWSTRASSHAIAAGR